MAAPAQSTLVIDTTTVLSLLTTVLILLAAYTLSTRLLPASSPTRTRVLFVWHAFDSLIHLLLEGSFLYNCFFVASAPLSAAELLASTLEHVRAPPVVGGLASKAVHHLRLLVTPPGVHFLNDPGRLYGPAYGEGPSSRLWQEYAKADRRWGGADLTVVSLELLTVFLGAPLAAYVCYLLIAQGDVATRKGASRLGGAVSFWMALLATGELYGGFMTFAPEWLTGNPNLDTSNFMYLWVYLVFFNMLWVLLPLWALREAYVSITSADADSGAEKKTK